VGPDVDGSLKIGDEVICILQDQDFTATCIFFLLRGEKREPGERAGKPFGGEGKI
jgi:hypothetical protein